MSQMLARAGALHNIDTDLLASVVQAESNGNALAVSRAGAGPDAAHARDRLRPWRPRLLRARAEHRRRHRLSRPLLTRYHDDIALALAAYNAGPAAVDRYHGIPPYAETRAYVARVIREFNRRKRAAGAPSRRRTFARRTPGDPTDEKTPGRSLARSLHRAGPPRLPQSRPHPLRLGNVLAATPPHRLDSHRRRYRPHLHHLRPARLPLVHLPRPHQKSLAVRPPRTAVYRIHRRCLFGRLADLIRPALIAKRVQLPISTQIAVYTIERMFDLGAAAIIFSSALLFAPPGLPHREIFIHTGVVSLGLTAFIAIFAVIVRVAGGAVAPRSMPRFTRSRSPSPTASPTKIRGFRDGLNAISSARLPRRHSHLARHVGPHRLAYVQTLHAFVETPELATISFSRTMLLLGASLGASLLQFPIIGWFTQIAAAALAMNQFYGAPIEAATACGALLFIVTWLSIIPAGLISARLNHVNLKNAAAESGGVKRQSSDLTRPASMTVESALSKTSNQQLAYTELATFVKGTPVPATPSPLDLVPHRRYNPLLRQWILVSPQRTQRPWQGETSKQSSAPGLAYDPTCYLCPTNARSGGVHNPDYTAVYAFDNDFPALLPDEPPSSPPNSSPLLLAEPERGRCRVLCFHPDHSLTLARMSVPEIGAVVDAWASKPPPSGNCPLSITFRSSRTAAP